MNGTSPSLLQRLREHPDAASWQRFTDVYSPFLHQWLRQYGVQPSDADDLVQEVLVVVLREMPNFHYDPDKGAFRGWLRTILVHRLQPFRRDKSKRPAAVGGSDLGLLLEQLEDPKSASSQRWDQEHDQFVVSRLLGLIQGEFTAPTWRAFQRLALDGASTEEVAAELGMTPNAVFIAKSRVLRRLREEVQGLAETA